MKKKLLLIPILGIALFNTAFGLSSFDTEYIENLFNNVSSCGGCDTAQESCVQYCDMYVMDDPMCMLTCNNPYYLSCIDSHCSESSESTSDSIISSDQIAGMGTALLQGGSGLLHIFILLMPYAIAMTIIMLIFVLIKNWSNLKNSWSNYKIYRKYKVPYKEFRSQTGGSRKEYRSWVKKTFKKF